MHALYGVILELDRACCRMPDAATPLLLYSDAPNWAVARSFNGGIFRENSLDEEFFQSIREAQIMIKEHFKE